MRSAPGGNSCGPPIASAQPRRSASRSSGVTSSSVPRASRLASGAVAVVRVDDLLDKRVPHDVGAREVTKRDAAHALEDARRLDEAALLAAPQVDLRHVA